MSFIKLVDSRYNLQKLLLKAKYGLGVPQFRKGGTKAFVQASYAREIAEQV